MRLSNNKTTIFNLASTIVLQGMAFISGPIFSTILGTENYGIAAVYLTWVSLASTIFSLQAAGGIAVARISFAKEEQPKYQSSVFSLATSSFFCFSVLTICIVLFLQKWMSIQLPIVLFGLIQAWGMYCVSAMNIKLTYEFKADKNCILSVLTTGLTIGCSIILINVFPTETNYWGRIIGQSLVYAIIGIILYWVVYSSGRTFYNLEYWRFTLPIAIPTIFHSLANIILNQSDKVMIQTMVGNSAVGIYALAATFGTVLHSIWNAFNNSWVAYYYEYTKQGQISEMKKHANNYLELFTILSMGFILLAKEVFRLYANQNFWDGIDLIPLFALGHYFVFLYSFPVNYEFYHKKTKAIATGTSLAAVCNVILNYFLIRKWGIYGAVIATALSHGMQFLFHYYCAKRIVPGHFPFLFSWFVPGIISVGVAGIVYWLTRELWFIRWALGMVLGVYLLVRITKRKEIF